MKDVYDQYLYEGTAQDLLDFFEKPVEERYALAESKSHDVCVLLADLHTAYRKMSHDFDKCLTALVAHMHADVVIEDFAKELESMPSIHPHPHELAGKFLDLSENAPEIFKKFGNRIRVEDWYDRVMGELWPTSRSKGLEMAESYAHNAAEQNVQRGSQDVVLCYDDKGERVLLHHDWVKDGKILG